MIYDAQARKDYKAQARADIRKEGSARLHRLVRHQFRSGRNE